MEDSQCVKTTLTRGQTMGLLIAAETGFISFTAVLVLFGIIIRNVVRNRRKPPHENSRLIKSPLDVYMLSLLSSDLIQGLGKILDVKWLHEGVVQCGSYCTAQGVIQQLGETSVAQATMAIAVHTFMIVFFRKGRKTIRLAVLVVCAIWLYVILFVAIGAGTHTKENDKYDVPGPYWCWIRTKSKGLWIAGEYFWLWSTGALSLALYIPLFFCLRGNIVTLDEDRWWKIRFQRTSKSKILGEKSADLPEGRWQDSKAAREAFIMLLYPASYIILVLPNSVCRGIGDGRVPPTAVFFATSLFGLSGLVNVALLLYTRPGLLLLDQTARGTASGPVFASTESLTSSAREDTGLRLRPLHPVLNLGTDDNDSGKPQGP